MPSILVTYSDSTTTTVTSASISLVATGGTYQHSSKAVKSLEFTLSTGSVATINVSASSSMPAQSCFAGVDPGDPSPFDCEWTMSSSTAGALVLTIPSSSSASYRARLAFTSGDKLDIDVAH